MWLLLALALRLGEPAPDLVLAGGGRLSELRGREVVVVCVGQAGTVPNAAVVRSAAPCGAHLLLIDRAGVLRRIEREPADPAKVVESWRLGRATFAGICARCHGPDGNSELYQDIKKLGGIGNRLSEAQIRARIFTTRLGPDHFLVRSYSLKAREMEALVRYVEGL